MNPRYLYLLFFVFLAACSGAPQQVHAPAIASASASACSGSTLERSDNVAGFGGCSHIFGDLRIENTGHSDLSVLSNLRSVSGTLLIAANPNLSSLKGLEGLSSVGHVAVLNNPRLTDASALSGLSEAKAISIIGNPRLMALSGPDTLRHLEGLVIADNDGLINLSGFGGLITAGDVVISNNRGLIRMSGLADLTFAEHLYLEDNPRLAPTPKLFRSLAKVEQELSIGQCPGVERSDVIAAEHDEPVATLGDAPTSSSLVSAQ